MELLMDWKSFRLIFPKKNSFNKIFLLDAEGLPKELSTPLEEVKSQGSAIKLNTDVIKQHIEQILCMDNFYQQAFFISKHAMSLKKDFYPNFFFELIKSFRLFLPARFGVYICLKGSIEKRLFMIFYKENLLQFYCPETTSEMSQTLEELRKYNRIPVIGFSAVETAWMQWYHMESPWRAIFISLWNHKSQLLPFSIVRFLQIALKALFYQS